MCRQNLEETRYGPLTIIRASQWLYLPLWIFGRMTIPEHIAIHKPCFKKEATVHFKVPPELCEHWCLNQSNYIYIYIYT